MNSKTLLLLGAIGAVAMASAEAQVYSVNAVGYVNVTVPVGFSMIANQLKSSNTKISALLPAPPAGTQIFKYVSGTGYVGYTFDDIDNAWLPDGNATLNPGEGAFIKNNSAAAFKVTFVGDVPTGTLTTPLPSGYSIVSSQVPIGGPVTTALSLPGTPGDQVLKYVPGTGYVVSTFDDIDNTWLPSVPSVAVGESFFLRRSTAGSWTRTFSVN
jgi:hypothetical protein